ncbi:MAG: DUF2332 family protein [Rhizobiaceae bacterium]
MTLPEQAASERERIIRTAFQTQAIACASLGSPFMARLMRLVGEKLDRSTKTGVYVLDWAGDPSVSADSVPLRLAGALHALVLGEQDEGLSRCYPASGVSVSDEELLGSVRSALAVHADFMMQFMKSAPQTNEVRRAAGILPAIALAVQRSGVASVRFLELGASAGLNLCCDWFALEMGDEVLGKVDSPLRLTPDWTGSTAPVANYDVILRSGCDLNPLDIHDGEAVMRLKAYTWPDQFDRLERLDQAIAIAGEVLQPGMLMSADAGDWLTDRLAETDHAALTVIWHTIAWQYFSQGSADNASRAIFEAAARATRQAPLAWLAIEADGLQGAAIRLRLWPEGYDAVVGRMDFHGRWVSWNA